MLPIKALLRQFLRGRQLVTLAVVALPFLLLFALGIVWLAENGLALTFALVTGGLIVFYRLVALLVLWVERRRASAQPPAPPADDTPLVAENPDWTHRERQAFQTLCQEIRDKLKSPLPWPAMQNEALETAKRAAVLHSDGKRDVLSFSIPEALLLANRVTAQLRSDIRKYVPLAETVSLTTLFWIWRHRKWIGHAVTAHRLYKAYRNMPVAIANEAQGLMLGVDAETVKSTGEAIVQRLLLEEVAKASLDLFGGHLRFSDAELLEITLESQTADLAHQAQEDLPLRVVVVGQVSSGKTSLINALAGEDRGETDVTPTTPALVSHHLDLAGEGFTFADTEGIDGSEAVNKRLLAQLSGADLLLWVVRANRPARAPDLALLRAFRKAMADNPARRAPRIIVVVTGIDQLIPAWPLPENLMGPQDQALVAEVMRSISHDLGEPLPVPAVATTPSWNIAQLETQIGLAVPEAMLVQRNRRRLSSAAKAGGLLAETSTAGKGVLKAGQLLWRGWRS
ncbi:GTPase [Neotabrizicola sp. VNH66]|uniref:GTPase n=1 Tax=Neotabrizicola sp. VNH66 TaxID=3400918 RepID=UPI003C0F70BF